MCARLRVDISSAYSRWNARRRDALLDSRMECLFNHVIQEIGFDIAIGYLRIGDMILGKAQPAKESIGVHAYSRVRP